MTGLIAAPVVLLAALTHPDMHQLASAEANPRVVELLPGPQRPVSDCDGRAGTPKAAAGPASALDLAATIIEVEPPRDPVQSRRNHEQRTALLMMSLNFDGRVKKISTVQL